MPRRALITGARGFIGANLVVALKRSEGIEVLEFDIENDAKDLEHMAGQADVVFHLAGVNRPEDPAEFEQGNAELTRRLCEALSHNERKPALVISSTIQAVLDNPYGRSKKAAEDVAFEHARRAGAKVHVFRLPNVFGKWCRPNYNSVVATFCHNLARGLPIQVNDPGHQLQLVYVDDVVRGFIGILEGKEPEMDGEFSCLRPVHELSLGALEEMLRNFVASRSTLVLPDMADPLTRKMYATYISYLPPDELAFGLVRREDERGALAEVLKTPHAGQLFFSTTKPGIIRGNHYHDSKVEKFIVVSGQAVVRFEQILTGEQVEVPVSGHEMKVVDIPPGYTHHIENVGDSELVVLFWANQMFDPEEPDTYFQEVRRG